MQLYTTIFLRACSQSAFSVSLPKHLLHINILKQLGQAIRTTGNLSTP